MKTPAFALSLAAILFAFAPPLFAIETPLAIDKSRSHIEAMVTSTMDNFTAQLTAYDAIVSVDLSEKRIGNAQLKFRFADIKTSDEKRDAEIYAWQQIDQFPDCIYILDALQPAIGGTFKARGRFILHGIRKEITIPVTIGFSSAGTCMIDGDLTLDTTDFGLSPVHKYVIFKVSPTFQVKFHLEGRASSER